MSVIDVTAIKEKAERVLLDRLQEVQGHKLLILDQDLSGPLSLVVTFSVLQQHGIDKIYYLHDGPPPDSSSNQINLVYLMRPTEENINYLHSHIKRLSAVQGTIYDFTVMFSPRRTLAADLILEEKGIAGDVNVLTLPLGFIPLDDDVLSLELPNAGFEDLYLRGTSSPIYHSALSLQEIQASYGAFPKIIGKGNNAREMADILRRLQEEADVSRNSIERDQPSSFLLEQLIIIERSDDFISPLLCQLTYEGLIDELYGIKNGQVELPNSIASPSQDNGTSAGSSSSSTTNAAAPDRRRTKKVPLDARDALFKDLRDMNFASVGATLNKIAKKLSDDYEERHQAKTVSQIKEFVNKLGSLQTEHQSLRMHTNLAEAIMNVTQGETFNKSLEFQQNLVADGLNMTILHGIFEELIYQKIALKTVLRLWCIECLVNNGMKDKDFTFFKTIFLQSYGYQHLLTLETLAKMGLLFPRSKPPNNFSFYSLRKQMHLIIDQLDEQLPQDISYVFSGYAPLSLRIVQSALDRKAASKNSKSTVSVPDWRSAEDILRNIPGESFELQGTQPTNAGPSRGLLQADSSSKRATVVYFLGGITYAEIAALRLLSKQLKVPGEIMIATTGIISGDKIMDVSLAGTPDEPLTS